MTPETKINLTLWLEVALSLALPFIFWGLYAWLT
jgi:hypothetical protein